MEGSFFLPQAVAIIGASEEKGQIGSGLYKCLSASVSEVYCVNPRHKRLFGQQCYPHVGVLPQNVTHAFIAVHRDLVLPTLESCADAGITNIIIISSGFKEVDTTGADLERQIAHCAATRHLTVLGPNTLGILNTAISLNGTFLPTKTLPGSVSIICQSGGVGMTLLFALADQRCGIAKWVGIGNEASVDALEVLEYLATDPETGAIAICFEGLKNMSAVLARASVLQHSKPIVLLRDGVSAVGIHAAVSHTGAIVFSGAVMPSLIRQAGLPEATSCQACAAMLKALCLCTRPAGNRVAIMTNTLGPAILCADAMESQGVLLPPVSDELRNAIDQEVGIPMALGNPADISSHGLSPKIYGIAAKHLLESNGFDVLTAFFSLNEHLLLPQAEIIRAAATAQKPAVACFLSTWQEFAAFTPEVEAYGIPCFCNPNDTAAAVTAIVTHAEACRRTQIPLPLALTPQQEEHCRAYLAQLPHRGILSEGESRTLVNAAGIPAYIPLTVCTPEAALAAATQCGFPVALKLESHTITHKSAVGGVRLHLQTPAQVYDAAEEMLPALRKLDEHATLTVQPMISDGFELILGAVRSAYGVLLMVGMGGIYAEALADHGFCMLPLHQGDLPRLLRSLRCHRVLYQNDGSPRFCEALLEDVLVRMGNLMTCFPQLSEMELNPCRVFSDRLAVLDARITLDQPAQNQI